MPVNPSTYHPASCTDALEYSNRQCVRTDNGGIRHFILVEKNYQPTLVAALDAATNDQQAYIAAWIAAKNAGKIIVVPNVLGEYDGGSPVESQGYGGAQTRLTGMEHTATIDDINVVGNYAFANALRTTQNYVLWFATSSLIWNTHVPCGAFAGLPVTREYTSELKYVYTVKWSHPDTPSPYDLPGFLFDDQAFSSSIVNTVFNRSGANVAATFVANFEAPCPAASSGTITMTGVEYDNGTTVVASSGWALTGSPVAIAAGDTSKSLPVTGPVTPLAAGTYIFTFLVSGCGQSAPQTVRTIVVV
jgi:hypothetical protein